MIGVFQHIKRGLQRFRSSEVGSVTVEFAILFPPFMLIFLSAMESGLFMLRNAMLERGLDLAVREIRIGTPVPPTFEQFRQQICDVALVIPKCMESLQVELQVVSADSWQPLDASARCVDKESEIDPFDNSDSFYATGNNNDFMLVRLCANIDPILPGIGLGALLDSDGKNGYAIVATSAFVNEPTRAN